MKEASIEEIIETTKGYDKNGVSWHHHFLTSKCGLNKSSKFQIILENEDTGETFFTEFDKKPMKELELLENLFFKRKK